MIWGCASRSEPNDRTNISNRDTQLYIPYRYSSAEINPYAWSLVVLRAAILYGFPVRERQHCVQYILVAHIHFGRTGPKCFVRACVVAWWHFIVKCIFICAHIVRSHLHTFVMENLSLSPFRSHLSRFTEIGRLGKQLERWFGGRYARFRKLCFFLIITCWVLLGNYCICNNLWDDLDKCNLQC